MKNHSALCGIIFCMCMLISGCSVPDNPIYTTEAVETTEMSEESAIPMAYSEYVNDAGAEYILMDGTLYGRGNNFLGFFGPDTAQVYEEWTQLTDIQNIIHIEAACGGIAFLTETGDVYAFGMSEGLFTPLDLNNEGQIVSSPRLISQDCVYMSLGVRFILLLKPDNTLWFMGESKNGQSTKVEDYIFTPRKIAENVLSIKAFGYTSAWIDESYSLYLCGDNSYGQIGNGHEGTGLPTLYEDIVSEPFLALENCKEISITDDYHIRAKTKDGKLYTWGGKYGNTPKVSG